MQIEEAIEVFGCGFTFTRSFTYPYLFEHVGPLWVMRDAPRKQPKYRNEEWLVHGISPREADAVIQANRRERFTICAFRTLDEPEEPIKAGFKGLGYRFLGSEFCFDHDLTQIPATECMYTVQQVTDQPMADQLNRATRARQIRLEDLAQDHARLRQYMALDGADPVGWVRSIACGKSGWCSNMFVRAEYRRQGIAKALMCQMLRDDRAHGMTSAVLLASHAGAMLYPTVGYRLLGHLLLFAPVRSSLPAKSK